MTRCLVFGAGRNQDKSGGLLIVDDCLPVSLFHFQPERRRSRPSAASRRASPPRARPVIVNEKWLTSFVMCMRNYGRTIGKQCADLGKPYAVRTAIGARPGRVTVHCWSKVRSFVLFPGAMTSLQK